jgi:TonB family protein
MQLDNQLKFTLLFLVPFLAGPILNNSQEKVPNSPVKTAVPSTYPNTTTGLQQLMKAMLDAAKSDDSRKLAELLKDTEIPNCGAWPHTMYEPGSADSWMGLCDAKTFEAKEQSLAEQFSKFAKEDGELVTRKVNDNPEPGRGMEWGMLQAIRQPLDIYYASWKTTKAPKAEPIGYFMFIDGRFRWENDIRFLEPRIVHAKIVLPTLVKRVDPVYPLDANALGIRGTVRVQFRVDIYGAVREVHAVSGMGLSDNPRLRKAAEDAVKHWQYLPGTVDGKPAVLLDMMTAEFAFGGGN